MSRFFGSYVALVTPMKSDGSLDEKAFRQLLKWHEESGTQGVAVASTTGEGPTLSEEESLRLFSIALEYQDKMEILLGLGGNDTAQLVARGRRARAAGARRVLSAVPAYNKPTQEGLFRHYSALVEGSELEVMLYDVPGRTIISLAPETIARLNQRYPGHIQSLKFSGEDLDRAAKIRALLGPDFAILGGSDELSLRLYERAGAQGVVSVTANVMPKEMARIWEALSQGNLSTAKALDKTLSALHPVLMIESNPIPTKYALFQMRRIENHLRLPLTPLSEAAKPQVDKVLRDLKLV